MNPGNSLLSNRQRDELHRSILAYLASANLQTAFSALKDELAQHYGVQSSTAVNGEDEQRYKGLLEKKWTSVIRLQKKIMDLEARLHALQAELDSAPSSMRQRNVDPVAWIPRAPARHSLSGHRMAITGLAFHPTFTVLASCSDDTTVKIWDWETGEFEQTIKGHTKSVHDVDFSPDGKMLVSCSSDLTLKIWDTSNAYSNLKTFHGHDHTISSVRFVSPRSDLAISCSRDRSIRVWDVLSGYCIRTISDAHADWIRRVSPSDDGAWYLSAGNDQVARLWDAQGKANDCKYELRGHEHVIECAIFAPISAYTYLCELAQMPKMKTLEPGRFVATGSRDKTIRLWSAQGGEAFKVLTGHDNWVRALAFHPGGKFLLSSADDKTIRCWDLEQQGRCVRTIEEAHSHFITCLRWAPGGHSRNPQTNGSLNGENTDHMSSGMRCVVASGSVDLEVKIWMP